MAREAFFWRHQELPTGRRARSLTLGFRLKVPAHLLDAWMHGLSSMPDRKLILLANILDQFSTKP